MPQKNLYKDFAVKVKELKKNTPFLVTLTLFGEKAKPGKELETFLFVNNFPYEEIPGTKDEVNRLLGEIKK